RLIVSALDSERVRPATECPAAFNAGTNSRPTAPVAPATKTRMLDLLALRPTAGRPSNCDFKRMIAAASSGTADVIDPESRGTRGAVRRRRRACTSVHARG